MPSDIETPGIQATRYQIVYNRSRFPKQPKREDGSWGCRGCGGVIPKGRSAWCSKACCDKWHPAFVMSNVRDRDKDICAMCGFILKEALAKWWSEKVDGMDDGWQAHYRWLRSKPVMNYDHIIPFSEGGMTVLENIRTLCEKCHKKRTKDWHADRKKKRGLSPKESSTATLTTKEKKVTEDLG